LIATVCDLESLLQIPGQKTHFLLHWRLHAVDSNMCIRKRVTAARVGAKTNSGAGVRCEKDGGGEWGKCGPQEGG